MIKSHHILSLVFIFIILLLARTHASSHHHITHEQDISSLFDVINASNIRIVFSFLNGEHPVTASLPQQEQHETHQQQYPITAVSFDVDMAKRAAAYSSISRCLTVNPLSIQNWSCLWCNDGKVPALVDVTADITGAEELGWYVGFDKANRRIVVNFRSTNNLNNWLVNLTILKISYPGCAGCEVHKGFLGAYKVVRASMVPAIDALKKKYGNVPISIQGHSQGGALTTHATLDFHNGMFVEYNFNGISYFHNHNPQAEMYNDIPTAQLSALSHFNTHHETPAQQLATALYTLSFPIYTFGAPRVGNAAWAKFFDQHIGHNNLLRVTHAGDVVPHVPITAIGYIQIGVEIWLKNAYPNEEYKICSTSTTEDESCSNSSPVFGIFDHEHYYYSMLQQDSDCGD